MNEHQEPNEGRFISGVSLMEFGLLCDRSLTGRAMTNCPHYIIKHSPTGQEWGYGGSGPADLAINTLYHAIELCPEVMAINPIAGERENDNKLRKVLPIYQEFKRTQIATIGEEGGFIPIESIKAFIYFSYQTKPKEPLNENEALVIAIPRFLINDTFARAAEDIEITNYSELRDQFQEGLIAQLEREANDIGFGYPCYARMIWADNAPCDYGVLVCRFRSSANSTKTENKKLKELDELIMSYSSIKILEIADIDFVTITTSANNGVYGLDSGRSSD